MKFNEDGTVRHFPGNTFICHLKKNSKHADFSMWAQDRLRELPFSGKLSFLPLDSMHMTVFEGVCDQVRTQEKWTSKLDLNVDLDETRQLFLKEVANMNEFAGFSMKFEAMYHHKRAGISIGLVESDEISIQTIKQCREKLSDLTGIRMGDFDSYRFHISLCYEIIELNDKEMDILYKKFDEINKELSSSFGNLVHKQMDYCQFDDMFNFTPIKSFLLIQNRTIQSGVRKPKSPNSFA